MVAPASKRQLLLKTHAFCIRWKLNIHYIIQQAHCKQNVRLMTIVISFESGTVQFFVKFRKYALDFHSDSEDYSVAGTSLQCCTLHSWRHNHSALAWSLVVAISISSFNRWRQSKGNIDLRRPPPTWKWSTQISPDYRPNHGPYSIIFEDAKIWLTKCVQMMDVDNGMFASWNWQIRCLPDVRTWMYRVVVWYKSSMTRVWHY